MGSEALHQIGEVAEAHLLLRTIRCYEEVGLVAPTERTDGGFPLYSDATMLRRSASPRSGSAATPK